jgi:hypothetical protein
MHRINLKELEALERTSSLSLLMDFLPALPGSPNKLTRAAFG